MVRSSIARALRGLRGQPKAGPSGSPSSLAQFGPDHKVRHLSLIDILRDLEQPVLRWLADHTTMITAQRGQLIYTPGETREGLFLLKAGSIRLYRLTADGKKLILSPVGRQGRRGRWIAMAVTSALRLTSVRPSPFT